jgi:hypothetical protein
MKLSLSALCAYLLLFNLYIYELKYGTLQIEYTKCLYSVLTAGIVAFIYYDRCDTHGWHKQINQISFWCLMSNFLLIILTHLQILTTPVKMFLTFNGAVFAITIMILILGVKYDYINQDYENDGQP